MFNLNDYHFELPKQQIARYPLPQRSASRLLGLDRSSQAMQHGFFSQLPELLQPNDLLVFNNTRVMPARLFARKTSGGKVEILVERLLDQQRALAHVRASKTPKPGAQLVVDDQVSVLVAERHGDLFELIFPSDVLTILQQHGHVPLPPYLERSDEKIDLERYQTVYATKQGAVAAPTAGLHFDEALLQQLQNQSIAMTYITLHVGAGTFQPVRAHDIRQHQIHAEYFEVSSETCEKIIAIKKQGGRVIAVGTTSVRALETATADGEIKPLCGDTRSFIYPGYRFRCVDALITNFHLPESSLLMLVCAFGGYDFMMNAYREAIRQGYRFYSYGDSMFIR